jgi:hypothetical protein
VNDDGETIGNYRKRFLYYTDETWALEGQEGFYNGFIPGLGTTAMGICRLPLFHLRRRAKPANPSLGMDLKLVYPVKSTALDTDCQ